MGRGLGRLMLDGQEITQFTYFQQYEGVDLCPISAKLTYGLERIAQFFPDSGLDLRHRLGAGP